MLQNLVAHPLKKPVLNVGKQRSRWTALVVWKKPKVVINHCLEETEGGDQSVDVEDNLTFSRSQVNYIVKNVTKESKEDEKNTKIASKKRPSSRKSRKAHSSSDDSDSSSSSSSSDLGSDSDRDRPRRHK
jgi:hypothetical protein